MPRIKRLKLETAIYHVMARSISEVDLFKDEADKNRYIEIIKEYQKIFKFKVYAYCLMDNHLHMILDGNGADISKIMHCINFKYAQYFNKIHKRHGHLFQDRFRSKIVNSDRYLMALTAYIHNNPTAIRGYEVRPERYPYSSLSEYMGKRKDAFGILDSSFILCFFNRNIGVSKERYAEIVLKTTEMPKESAIKEDEVEFNNEETEYRSGRKILTRNLKPEDIIEYVAKKHNIEREKLYIKSRSSYIKPRAVLILLLRSLCNLSCKDICAVIGGITQSRVSKLCSIGLKLIESDLKYKEMYEEFIVIYCG
jgi:REP element-mobilizing transposase RayT